MQRLEAWQSPLGHTPRAVRIRAPSVICIILSMWPFAWGDWDAMIATWIRLLFKNPLNTTEENAQQIFKVTQLNNVFAKRIKKQKENPGIKLCNFEKEKKKLCNFGIFWIPVYPVLFLTSGLVVFEGVVSATIKSGLHGPQTGRFLEETMWTMRKRWL